MEPSNDNEIWKDIPGWAGLYQASNLGRIRSLDRMRPGKNGHLQIARGRVLTPIRAPGATYQKVCLSIALAPKKQVVRQRNIHRLVLCAFTGKPLNHPMEVDHVNGDPSDNHLENLRWCVRAMNVRNRFVGVGTSATVGVWYQSRFRKPWVAQACKDGKKVFSARFYTEEEAVAARKKFEEESRWREVL